MFAPHKIIESLWRDSDGSALVEATLLTPVLIFLFFGVFEFSWYFYNQQLAEVGVRDAARYLARGPYISAANLVTEGDNPCQDASNVAAAKNLAVYGTIDGTGSARVQGWAIGNVSISCPPFPNTAYDGPNPIYRVTVSTSFANPQLGFFGLLGLGIPNLSASHTERAFGTG